MERAANQLADELALRFEALESFLPPVATVAGLVEWQDIADDLVLRLLDGEDDLAVAIAVSLWPMADPPDDWWDTPLGRMLAQDSDLADRGIAVTEAGPMLGITHQGVSDLARRGRLRKHPDIGVQLRAVVLRRARMDRLPVSARGRVLPKRQWDDPVPDIPAQGQGERFGR